MGPRHKYRRAGCQVSVFGATPEYNESFYFQRRNLSPSTTVYGSFICPHFLLSSPEGTFARKQWGHSLAVNPCRLLPIRHISLADKRAVHKNFHF
jgi:hypothetical protein